MGQELSDQGMSSPKGLDAGNKQTNKNHDYLRDKGKTNVSVAESQGQRTIRQNWRGRPWRTCRVFWAMIRIITMTVFYSRQTGRPVKEFRYEGGHCSAGI